MWLTMRTIIQWPNNTRADHIDLPRRSDDNESECIANAAGLVRFCGKPDDVCAYSSCTEEVRIPSCMKNRPETAIARACIPQEHSAFGIASCADICADIDGDEQMSSPRAIADMGHMYIPRTMPPKDISTRTNRSEHCTHCHRSPHKPGVPIGFLQWPTKRRHTCARHKTQICAPTFTSAANYVVSPGHAGPTVHFIHLKKSSTGPRSRACRCTSRASVVTATIATLAASRIWTSVQDCQESSVIPNRSHSSAEHSNEHSAHVDSDWSQFIVVLK